MQTIFTHAIVLGVLLNCFLISHARAADSARPRNVIFILADDPGYGDLGCNGATLVKTPNIDKLAASGRRFTDFHAAPCCSAARYQLLTGQYNWRRDVPGVLPGNSPLMIPLNTPTLATVMKKAGYVTGGIGKWHLGFGEDKTNFNKDLKPGPLEIGFDSFFGFPATQDRVPCVYFQDHRVIGLDPADPIRVAFQEAGKQPGMTDNVAGRKRIGWMSGGKAALWDDNTMGKVLLDKTLSFIDQNKDKPFFLYFASHCVHAPTIPSAQFAGSSNLSRRIDQLQELDWTVGQIVDALAKHNLTNDTLLIFTSDNGSWLTEEKGEAGTHRPNAPYRGVKFTVYEGGHREPFIASWPKHIPAGTVCDEPLDFVDMISTFAAMTNQPPPDTGPDSKNAWPAFLGEKLEHPVHDTMLFGIARDKLAVRQGPWKLIPFRQDDRGHSATNKKAVEEKKGGEEKKVNNGPAIQLYNLETDPGESKNLANENPDKVRELQAALAKAVGK